MTFHKLFQLLSIALKVLMSEVTGELLDPALVILLYSWSELLPHILKHFVSPLSSPMYNVITVLH